MAKPKKVKIKITSSGMLVSFGYRVRTPAVVELYPNQIAILKSNGTEYEVLNDPNVSSGTSGETKRPPVAMLMGGMVKPRKGVNQKVAKEPKKTEGVQSNVGLVSGVAEKRRARKGKKAIFTPVKRRG